MILVRVEHVEDQTSGERRRVTRDALEGDLEIGLGDAAIAVDVDRAEAPEVLPERPCERLDEDYLALAPRARRGDAARVRGGVVHQRLDVVHPEEQLPHGRDAVDAV